VGLPVKPVKQVMQSFLQARYRRNS